MRPILALLLLTVTAFADDRPSPRFDILPGDRVLLLGDTLLERETTYGYLETRMHEQFADRPFTVRNLSFAGDTPLGLSRAAFDPPAAGWERMKASIATVRPTVVFLGYGMAASLQQLTEESHDPTLNADPARYGTEPMMAARFKKELGVLMNEIEKEAAGYLTAEAQRTQRGAEEGKKDSATAAPAPTKPSADLSNPSATLRSKPDAAPGGRVRFVLLSPIRHEDLRKERPGLPDPAAHNKLLAEYAKAIEELAQERGAQFVSFANFDVVRARRQVTDWPASFTDNGIHLSQRGYDEASLWIVGALGTLQPKGEWVKGGQTIDPALRAAVIAKIALFFHQFRPANSTYLFGFRKHEQGQNAKEMAMFDPLIAAAEAEIERLKKGGAAIPGRVGVPPAVPGVSPGTPNVAKAPTPTEAPRVSASASPSPAGSPAGTPKTAGGTPTQPVPPPHPPVTGEDR